MNTHSYISECVLFVCDEELDELSLTERPSPTFVFCFALANLIYNELQRWYKNLPLKTWDCRNCKMYFIFQISEKMINFLVKASTFCLITFNNVSLVS